MTDDHRFDCPVCERTFHIHEYGEDLAVEGQYREETGKEINVGEAPHLSINNEVNHVLPCSTCLSNLIEYGAELEYREVEA